jgi:predicted patatin/cPLA2 family phospholipase
MKTGIIDIGGGLKGAFGAGVFDWCMDHDVRFDYCIGVSAGAANCASYCAGQRGRNYRFYTHHSLSPRAMGPLNKLKTGSWIDLDYIYNKLSTKGGLDELDYDAMIASPTEFKIVATRAVDGVAVYFDKTQLQSDNYDIVCASCAMPVANRPYSVDGVAYYDGGVADPLPVERALQDGCDKVVAILTLPADHYRSGKNDKVYPQLRAYPVIQDKWAHAAEIYNERLKRMHELVDDGRGLIVAPEQFYDMKALGKNQEKINGIYQDGYRLAAPIADFLQG